MGVASLVQTTPTSSEPGSEVLLDDVMNKMVRKCGLVPVESWDSKVKEILTLIQLTKRHCKSLYIFTFQF